MLHALLSCKYAEFFVEKHIRRVHDDVFTFLSLFGNHFIEVINQNTRVVLPCLSISGLLGAKRISLREYLNNEPGMCHTINFDCPKKVHVKHVRKPKITSGARKMN
jgi:hypothetical protein